MPQSVTTIVPDFEAYSVISLQTYSSTEWLANNKKRYRQVFEERDLKYVYAELRLINKYFDRQDWSLDVELKCYRVQKGKKELCTLNINRSISKSDHEIYIREGWGHKKKGSFWKKGKYCWEAIINDQVVATKYFYIENVSDSFPQEPALALHVDEINFFEGNYEFNEEEDDKRYFTQFSLKKTRYVYAEIEIENRRLKSNWQAEIFIRFVNESRELKGQIVRLERIRKGDDRMYLHAGWGSNVRGSWRNGKYDVEIIFQDRLIARNSFSVGGDFIQGVKPVTYPDEIKNAALSHPLYQKGKNESLKSLNQLIGLSNIKKKIYEHTKYIQFLKLREKLGFDEEQKIQLHSIFTGNPGTGKTTVARLLGSIYHAIGLLPKGHVVEVGRADLVGEYIGQTAPKVKEVLEQARGGVLFIDEAYSLARSQDDSKDFGREVIEMLIKEMADPKCDFMVVVAGYPKEMNTFINSNPGLASRFKYSYQFDDYSFDELKQLMHYFTKEHQIELSKAAQTYLTGVIQNDYRERNRSFGNARYVSQLLEKAKINLGIRIMSDKSIKPTAHDVKWVELQDVKPIKSLRRQPKYNLILDQEALDEAMQELHQLIGMKSIKKQLTELVELVQYKTRKGQLVNSQFNFHAVLIGNPGTGKTTVTRICARIFKALGVLEKGHLVETDRQGLIAGYVGQTALKTTAIIEESIGGLLFIDEAYALIRQGAHNDFGDEAIQTMLKQMEDRRGEFFVFAAGYPKEMDSFLKQNPGLKSRFKLYFTFEDFSESELFRIAKYFFDEQNLKMSSQATDLLKTKLEQDYRARDAYFGNARYVRNVVDDIIKYHNLRLAAENVFEHTSSYHRLIKGQDVQQVLDNENINYEYKRKGIGFNKG